MRNHQRPGRSVAMSAEAMAATSQPLATQTALQILRAGGNALDAAIAASATPLGGGELLDGNRRRLLYFIP